MSKGYQYIIVSPDGITHEIKNLKAWCDEHGWSYRGTRAASRNDGAYVPHYLMGWTITCLYEPPETFSRDFFWENVTYTQGDKSWVGDTASVAEQMGLSIDDFILEINVNRIQYFVFGLQRRTPPGIPTKMYVTWPTGEIDRIVSIKHVTEALGLSYSMAMKQVAGFRVDPIRTAGLVFSAADRWTIPDKRRMATVKKYFVTFPDGSGKIFLGLPSIAAHLGVDAKVMADKLRYTGNKFEGCTIDCVGMPGTHLVAPSEDAERPIFIGKDGLPGPIEGAWNEHLP